MKLTKLKKLNYYQSDEINEIKKIKLNYQSK